MSETVMKCKFCGALYELYGHLVGDQTVCPKCRARAKKNSTPGPWLNPDTPKSWDLW